MASVTYFPRVSIYFLTQPVFGSCTVFTVFFTGSSISPSEYAYVKWLFNLFTAQRIAKLARSYPSSKCLSVYPSVTAWHCVKTEKDIVKLRRRHCMCSLILSVSRRYQNPAKFQLDHSHLGVKCRWGMKNCDFRPISRSLYLENDT